MRADAVDRAAEGSFQTEGRGIVPASGHGLYVVRDSDDELFDRLSRGEPCHVLAPRQIGKSSLRVRTQERLRARRVRCASIDLTSIGSSASADEWYFSLAASIAEELELQDDLDAFWSRNRRMSAVRRFRQFLHDRVLSERGEDVLLGESQAPVVVFLDEIDVTLSLPFSRDDFFGLIRATHQARAVDGRWSRLTFCLIGVAAPVDLVADPERTPFNTSFAVRVDDFTRAEARAFLPALAKAGGDGEALLDAVLGWTGGHPALTQRLCYRLTRQPDEDREAAAVERVSTLVRRLFLSSGRIDDPILLDAERRFAGDRPDARIPVMLHLYQRLLDGEPVPVDGNNPRQFGLRIAGLAAERREGEGMVLRVRNRIFAEVFNRAWVEEKLARRFLTEPLQIWKDSGRKDDHVLRGGALEIALAWAQGREDVTPDERDFLQASQAFSSREQQERQQAEIDRTQRERAEQKVRAQRTLVMLLSLSAVLAALLLCVALFYYRQLQAALEKEHALRAAVEKSLEALRTGSEDRLHALAQDQRKAEAELARALQQRDEATRAAKLARADADAAAEAAREARRRAAGSSSREKRARDLEAAAKKKAAAAASLEGKMTDAEAAVSEATRRLEKANAANLTVRVAAQQQTESVLSSVQSALTAERAATARLQEELRRESSEADQAKAELERLNASVAQLKEAVERLTKDRDAALQQLSALRQLAPPPPAQAPASEPRGKDADGEAGVYE